MTTFQIGMHLRFSFLVICLLSAAFSRAQHDDDGVPYISGEWIVKIESGHAVQKILEDAATVFQETLVVERILSTNSQIYLLAEFPLSNESSWRAKRDWLQSHPAVQAAQFNHVVQQRETLPNDPGISNQWHHVNSNDSDIDSDLAWDITTGGSTAMGENIVVCVIEGGGANFNHNDLNANHWTNEAEIPNNGIDDDANGFVDDFDGWNPVQENDNIPSGGHGTAVSGMIGATGNNGAGGAGVNWKVDLMQVVIGPLNEANVIASYDYPFTMRSLYNASGGTAGALVVATNASWGIDNADPANYPVWCAYYDDLGAAGILNCGATANNDVNVDLVGDMPTACGSDYMISVTATDDNDDRNFSAYGPNSVDLAAPGESVRLPNGFGGYGWHSGTSFASPAVAGSVALLYSAPCDELAYLSVANPQSAADLVRAAILGGVDPVASLTGVTATGGRLNSRNSLDVLLAGCGSVPECEFTSFSGEAVCVYNEGLNTVEAAIELTVGLSEWFCTVDSICYAIPGQDTLYLDLQTLGIDFNNAHPTFTLTGLSSNTTYVLYATAANGISNTLTFSTPDCIIEVPGCTDPDALNYEFFATFEDGTCLYPCTNIIFELSTDCWANETGWQLLDDGGNVIQEILPGSLISENTATWEFCLDNGCYTLAVTDTFGDGMEGSTYIDCDTDGDFNMTYAAGPAIFSMDEVNFGSIEFHPFCIAYGVIPGCTDQLACNYEVLANQDNGECRYLGDSCDDNDPFTILDEIQVGCACAGYIGGCMDDVACNYEPDAEVDDGSCQYPGCTDPIADNFNPEAGCNDLSCVYSCNSYSFIISTDCWGAETAWDIVSEEGFVIYQSDYFSYQNEITINEAICLNTGCYTLNFYDSFGDGMNGTASGCPINGSFSLEDQFGNPMLSMLAPDGDFGFVESQDFCVPVPGALGCIDPLACNFTASAWIDDGSCTFPGCTDSTACNYDFFAGCDDGNCDFESCAGACFADFDNDGLRQVSDLLALLANVGCMTSCGLTDLNGDGTVSSPDLLALLTVFGLPCP